MLWSVGLGAQSGTKLTQGDRAAPVGGMARGLVREGRCPVWTLVVV